MYRDQDSNLGRTMPSALQADLVGRLSTPAGSVMKMLTRIIAFHSYLLLFLRVIYEIRTR
jgi:hypothetical protein